MLAMSAAATPLVHLVGALRVERAGAELTVAQVARKIIGQRAQPGTPT